MKTTTLTSLALLLHIHLTSAGNCTTFTWDNQPAYLRPAPPERISSAQYCPPNPNPKTNQTHYCPITATGDLQHAFVYNSTSKNLDNTALTTGKTPDTFLHSIILAAVNSSLNGVAWENNVIGLIDTTSTLSPGQAGYLNFTLLRRCFAGRMSNCSGGVEEGTGIEGCAPVTHTDRSEGGLPIFDGVVQVVGVGREDVEGGVYADPFGGQQRGGGDRGWGAVSGVLVVGGVVVALFGMG